MMFNYNATQIHLHHPPEELSAEQTSYRLADTLSLSHCQSHTVSICHHGRVEDFQSKDEKKMLSIVMLQTVLQLACEQL